MTRRIGVNESRVRVSLPKTVMMVSSPGASGTIRMGVAAPHSGASALVWTKQGGGRVHERHPNPSIRPLGGLEPVTHKPQCDRRSWINPVHYKGP